MAIDAPTQQEVERVRELARQFENGEISLNAMISALGPVLRSVEDYAVALAKAEASTAKQLEYMSEIEQMAEDASEALEARLSIEGIELEGQRERLRLLKEQAKTDMEAAKMRNAQGVSLIDQIKQEEKLLKIKEEQVAAGQNVVQQTQRIIGALTGISDSWKDSLVGSLLLAEDGLKKMAQAAKETITVSNVMGSMMQKTIQMTTKMFFAFDEAQVSLGLATGAGNKYNDMLGRTYSANGDLFASMGETSDVIGGLVNSYAAFNQLSAEQQDSMVRSGLIMQKLGVDTETFGQVTQEMVLALGQTPAQAESSAMQLADLGSQIGKSAQTMMTDFTAATPRLAMFGDEAVGIFEDLQRMSASTGVSMDTMLGVASRFDTFEDAGTAVGQLNAMMGSNLNMMDMMMATDEERIEMLVRATEAGDLNWNSMNRQQQMAVANAAGITNMAEAQEMFGNGVAGLHRYRDAQTDAATAQQNAEEAAQQNVTIMNKLLNTLERMFAPEGALYGAVTGFSNFITTVAEFAQENKGLIKGLGLAAMAFFAASKAIAAMKIIGTINNGIAAMTAKLNLNTGASDLNNLSQRTRTTTITTSDGVTKTFTTTTTMKSRATDIDTASNNRNSLSLKGIGAAAKTAAIGIGAVVAAFMIGKAIGDMIEDWSVGAKILVAVLVAAAAAMAAFWIASTLGVASAGIIAGWAAAAGGLGVLYGAFMEDGVTNYEGTRQGRADVVGEAGPELVTLPPRSNVITNENIERMSSIMTEKEILRQEIQMQAVAAGAQAGTAAAATTATNTNGGGGGGQPIVMKFKQREIARMVGGVMDGMITSKS